MQSRIVTTLALFVLAAAPCAVFAATASTDAETASSHDTGDIQMSDKFQQLDANGDGLLSREEAQADSSIGALYDSFDTSGTMEKQARNDRPGGITEEQFEAGLQAAASGGTIGPAASGGETLLVYPDGTMERVKGTGIKARD